MKQIYYIICILSFLFFSCKKEFSINNGQSEAFTKLYGSPFDNAGNSIQQLSDGGYILTGKVDEKKVSICAAGNYSVT